MIAHYEIRNADDDRLATLTTERDVTCRDDRAKGEAWVWVQVDEVGPSLRYATVKVNRTQRQGAQQGQGAPSGGQDDPWATGPSQGRQQPQQTPGWGNGQSYDEPPF